MSAVKVWKRIWRILLPAERGWVFIIYTICVLLSVISGIYSMSIAMVVNDVICKSWKNMMTLISLVFGSMFVQLAGNSFMTYRRATSTHFIAQRLRTSAMGDIYGMKYPCLDKEKPYELASNVLNGAEKAAELLCSSASALISDGALVVVVWIFTLRLHPLITLVYTLASACVACAQFLVSKPVEKKNALFGQACAAHDGFINVFAQNIDVMHAMHKEKVILTWYDGVLANFRAAFNRMIQAIFTFYPLGSILSIFPKCILLVLGCGLVARGVVSGGDVVGLLCLCQMSDRMLFGLVDHISGFRRNAGQAVRYFIIPEAREKPQLLHSERVDLTESEAKTPALSLMDVSFSYEDRAVLQHISLQVETNQHVALLGKSGSGKSTLLRLIAGELQPDAGTISYYGQNISDLIPGSEYRVGFMSNENAIFPTGIAENTALAEEGAEREQIDAALAKAELGQEKYRAVVNARELSGGEWQRIHLARSFVQRGMQIRIYDEPTNALDKGNLDKVAAHIFTRDQEGIVIVATHDAEVAALADQVILIEDGRIVQRREGRL